MNCHICSKSLVGAYLIDAWDNKMCESHFGKGVVHCSSCTAFTKREHVVSDGRVLCKRCYDATIKPGDSIEKIKTFVTKSLYNTGFSDLRIEDISLEIVSAQKLADLQKMPVNLDNKGFTLSNVTTSSLYGVLTTKQKFDHTIYMLTHLTSVEFAGTLAHEMLHAWLTQYNVNMPQKKMEGFCNMGTYLIYSSIKGTFAKMQLKFLHESADPIYGDGFREMYEHFKRLGWNELIADVRRKGVAGKYFPQVSHIYSGIQSVVNSIKI